MATTSAVRIHRSRRAPAAIRLLVAILAALVAVRGAELLSPSAGTTAERRAQSSEPTRPNAERGRGQAEASGLEPALEAALRDAAAAAANEGIALTVTSGRRSPEHQAELLREAIAEYGSEAEAARWVATPETSPHVSGDAVDVGPAAAAEWLGANGAAYGLCRVYANEPWHFELRPGAAETGCPAPFPDPTHDPRMKP